jgi:hypothetical protein
MSDRPIDTIKLFPLEVAIWAGKYGVNLSLQKRYKDKTTGEYKTTNFLTVSEAIVAGRIMDEAITKAIAWEKKQNAQQGNGSNRPEGGDEDPGF